jgi:hypothetical protein
VPAVSRSNFEGGTGMTKGAGSTRGQRDPAFKLKYSPSKLGFIVIFMAIIAGLGVSTYLSIFTPLFGPSTTSSHSPNLELIVYYFDQLGEYFEIVLSKEDILTDLCM